MENVRALVGEIKDNLVQKSASRKDEVSVAKAMLNDPTYQVGIYNKDGKVGDYCPYADSRKMFANIISATTKISTQEAQDLSNAYEVTKADATSMVNLSKEFANTYLQTGRKLPLGGRKTTNVSLIMKHVEEKEKIIPSKVEGGEVRKTTVPSHDTIKSSSPCPDWLK